MSIRKFMRGILLPVDEIKNIIKKSDINFSLNPILDFGAGTLFWSEWFADSLFANVIALDSIYKNNKPICNNKKISCCDSIDNLGDVEYSMIFACDVLHHVNKEDFDDLIEYFMRHSKFIVIKDINANDKIGDFQNRLHDFIINHQWVNKIYPDKLSAIFETNNFTVNTYYYKKYGYPHFLITAVKSS